MVQLARFVAGGIGLLLIGEFLDKKNLKNGTDSANNEKEGENGRKDTHGGNIGNSHSDSSQSIESQQKVGE